MYHSRFKGTHFEAGHRYGQLIQGNNKKLIAEFRLTPEKYRFAEDCQKAYAKHFPEVLDEIHGMAEGACIPFQDTAAFLFCMYSFPFENNCSCFAWNRGGSILFGRNSDFLVRLEKSNESVSYHLDGGYAFIGNTTAPIQMEDGVNEHGLAIGLTFTYPTVKKPGITAGLLVRYLLEKCRTVSEVLTSLQQLPISSSQILTMIDKTGEMAVVECNCENLTVIRPNDRENFVLATNQFMAPEMLKYRYQAVDDIHSWERYQTIQTALMKRDEGSVKFAEEILAGKYGFTCQYERSKGFDTVWSTVYDLTNLKVYRAEGNPSRKLYKEDKRLNFC
jgi:predicted choloylglycine hydrolase